MKQKKEIPTLWVDYEEYKPETYQGIVLVYEKDRFDFRSGDFDADYKAAYAKAESLGSKRVCESSSIFNYLCDIEK